MIVGMTIDKDGKVIAVSFDKGTAEEKEKVYKELVGDRKKKKWKDK